LQLEYPCLRYLARIRCHVPASSRRTWSSLPHWAKLMPRLWGTPRWAASLRAIDYSEKKSFDGLHANPSPAMRNAPCPLHVDATSRWAGDRRARV